MTPSQAASLIGCTPSQVRWMIRNGKLKAEKRKTINNQHGFEYVVLKRDAERIKNKYEEGHVGKPRGTTQPKTAIKR